MPATTYAEITDKIHRIIEEEHPETAPEATAYMITRAALLWIRGVRGPVDAASLAYRLADEFAVGDPK